MANEYVIKNGLIVGDLTYPTTDGSSGDVFTTDGSGNITLQAPSGGTSGAGSVERVRVDYNTSNVATSATAETAGVTATVGSSSIVTFTFTGHAYPPASIQVYAWDRPNSIWYIHTPDGSWSANRSFPGDLTDFGSYNGPMDLQLDQTNLASTLDSTFSNGAVAYVLFWFSD
jgi:hypothetical protein